MTTSANECPLHRGALGCAHIDEASVVWHRFSVEHVDPGNGRATMSTASRSEGAATEFREAYEAARDAFLSGDSDPMRAALAKLVRMI